MRVSMENLKALDVIIKKKKRRRKESWLTKKKKKKRAKGLIKISSSSSKYSNRGNNSNRGYNSNIDIILLSKEFSHFNNYCSLLFSNSNYSNNNNNINSYANNLLHYFSPPASRVRNLLLYQMMMTMDLMKIVNHLSYLIINLYSYQAMAVWRKESQQQKVTVKVEISKQKKVVLLRYLMQKVWLQFLI